MNPQPLSTPNTPAARQTVPADATLGQRLNALMHQQAEAMGKLNRSFEAYEKLIEREPWLTHGYKVA